MEADDTPLEYLTTVSVGESGQITVPKQFRKDLGLESGAPFALLRIGDGLILLPEQQRFEQLCRKVSVALTGACITPKKLLATLPEVRQRVFDRRHGKSVTAAPVTRRRRSRS